MWTWQHAGHRQIVAMPCLNNIAKVSLPCNERIRQSSWITNDQRKIFLPKKQNFGNIVANNFCQPLNFHDSSESTISFVSINVSASNVNGYFDKLGIVARFIFCWCVYCRNFQTCVPRVACFYLFYPPSQYVCLGYYFRSWLPDGSAPFFTKSINVRHY